MYISYAYQKKSHDQIESHVKPRFGMKRVRLPSHFHVFTL